MSFSPIVPSNDFNHVGVDGKKLLPTRKPLI